MAETASLIIKVDSSGADRATRSLGNLDKAASGSERAANKLGKAWGVAIGLIGSAAVIGATRNYIRLSDEFANMSAKLRLVRGSSEDAAKAQRDLFAMSQRNSSELAATTDLYIKLGQASEDLAANHGLLLSVTDKVSKALVISGADAASSAAVIRQFSQAMASGALRGDEFISVMEGAPRLAKAIADGMGVAVGSLRDLAAQGKLTRDVIIKALEDQGVALDREFGQMPLTVSRATTQVQNAMAQLVGSTDEAKGASKGLAESIAGLARVLESEETKRGFASMVDGIAGITSAMVSAMPKIAAFNEELKKSFGLAGEDGKRKANFSDITSGLGGVLGGIKSGDRAAGTASGKRMTAGLRNVWFGSNKQVADFSGVTSSVEQQSKARWGGVTSSVDGTWNKPTSTADSVEPIIARTRATQELTEAQKAWFALEQEILDHEDLANAARTDYTNQQIRRANQLEDEAERQKQATDGLINDMQFELSLIGMSNAEREREIALRHAGAGATDEQRRAIADLIDKIGKAREADGYVQDMKSGLGDLFSTIGQGSDAATASIDRMFENLKRRATQALADRAIEGLIQGFAGMAGGGGWAGFASGFGKGFTGRATGGPVNRGGLYEVGEGGKSELLQSGGKTYLIPGTSGTVIPAKAGGMAGGQSAPQVNVSIHNAPAGAEVQQKQNASGGMDIDVIFRQIESNIASNLSAGASPINAAMQGRYGLRTAI